MCQRSPTRDANADRIRPRDDAQKRERFSRESVLQYGTKRPTQRELLHMISITLETIRMHRKSKRTSRVDRLILSVWRLLKTNPTSALISFRNSGVVDTS